jgi:uncharacterized protein
MKNQMQTRKYNLSHLCAFTAICCLAVADSSEAEATNRQMAFHAQLTPLAVKDVTIEGGFWGPRVETNRTATLWAVYAQLEKSSREAGLKRRQATGDTNSPELLWCYGTPKWIEAAAYSLMTHPDEHLEKLVDTVIETMVTTQQSPDGYMDFVFPKPEDRWINLMNGHPLYRAGHLLEAGVAYYQATGKRRLLDASCRFADLMDSVFGPEEGKKHICDGHPEIELALVKLYRATGEQRYLRLAKYFIDERGRDPQVYAKEAAARGVDMVKFRANVDYRNDYWVAQSPVREQTTAEGHAVRAAYLFSGMADVGRESGDKTLFDACERIWKNVTERRMYITGGIGSGHVGERFTTDYDLPNETAYCETCASAAMMFWAHRMLQFEGNGIYADTLERVLYNGFISGVSQDGKAFFYLNPLAVHPEEFSHSKQAQYFTTTRQKTFSTPCCPPNLTRTLASLGKYIYSQGDDSLYVHLYVQGKGAIEMGGSKVILEQKTDYPWDETVNIKVQPEKPSAFRLALRIPEWCHGATARVNGKEQPLALQKGYLVIDRKWSAQDQVTLTLPMPVERVLANPAVQADRGMVALQRGPIVYCVEEKDNGRGLRSLVLPDEARLQAVFDPELLGGVTTIVGRAVREEQFVSQNQLYQRVDSSAKSKDVPFKAIPYFAWSNRGQGEMQVWVRRGDD